MNIKQIHHQAAHILQAARWDEGSIDREPHRAGQPSGKKKNLVKPLGKFPRYYFINEISLNRMLIMWCLLLRKCQLQWQLCCTEAWARSTSLRRFLLVARLDSPFPLLSICSPRWEMFWDSINTSLNQLLVSFVEKKADRDLHRCLSAVRASQCQC